MTATRKWLLALCAVALNLAAFDPADARRYRRDDDRWHDRWENRRDARRAGIVAGVVAGSVARGAAQQRVEQRYEDCLYATGYDYDCERMRYYDERNARRTARRTGVVVGITTHAIVRD